MHRTPPKIYGWMGALTALVAISIVVWTSFLAKKPEPAPSDAGVCWILNQGRFAPLSRNVANLESCAAGLERIYLDRGTDVNGAFQGRFIFIDDDAIRSASAIDGARWRVFYGPQREGLDRRIREAVRTGKSLNIGARPTS